MKYYQEEIEKNTVYRQEYKDGIDNFLEQERMKATERRNAFFTPEKYKANPMLYRGKLMEILGFPLTKEKSSPILKQKVLVAKDRNVLIYRMQLTFFGFLNFYGLYLEQEKQDCNTPFVVAIHGGAGTPEVISSIHMDSANYNHLVRRMTERGANVFVPQLLLWKQEYYGNEYNRIWTDGKLRQLGGSITALELYLLRGSIDYFIEEEKINAEKIGAAGLSYGGMYALHLAAIDERIKVCYSCSWVNDGFVQSWADWSYKNAQNFISVAETMALIAPRALVVGMGDKDDLFDSKYTEIECEKVKPYYQIYNRSENFKTVIFDGWHEAEKADECLSFLFKQLC